MKLRIIFVFSIVMCVAAIASGQRTTVIQVPNALPGVLMQSSIDDPPPSKYFSINIVPAQWPDGTIHPWVAWYYYQNENFVQTGSGMAPQGSVTGQSWNSEVHVNIPDLGTLEDGWSEAWDISDYTSWVPLPLQAIALTGTWTPATTPPTFEYWGTGTVGSTSVMLGCTYTQQSTGTFRERSAIAKGAVAALEFSSTGYASMRVSKGTALIRETAECLQ